MQRCKSRYYTAMIEDLSWFGIKWNLGPSSDDFPTQNNENNKTNKMKEDIGTNKIVGKKQRKKLKKSENNPEQIITDFNNTNLIDGINQKSESGNDSLSLLGVKNVPEDCQGTFIERSTCKVRISRACGTHVKNENENENSNRDEFESRGEKEREADIENKEAMMIKKKRIDFLKSELDNDVEIEDKNEIVDKDNNDIFLYRFNLGLFKNVCCQSNRIPLYLEAWKFLLKNKLSKI